MARVLVVDDMAAIREPMCFALRKAGHRADAASNGQDALALIRLSPPDVLVLDVHMPVMDGFEVLRHIHADPAFAAVQVILLTVDSDRNTVLTALKFGVKNYLLKSNLDFNVLLRRIAQMTAGTPALPPGGSEPANGAEAAAAAAPASESAVPPLTRPPAAPAAPLSRPLPASERPARPATSADAEEAIKSIKPIVKRSEIADRLDANRELRAVSPAVTEVLKLSRSPNSSLEAIARAIKHDPAITLKVLRLANSAAFSRGDAVESIDKAVVRIGAGAIGQAVMNLGMIEQFSGKSLSSVTDPRLFWEHSIGVALIAARVAGEVSGVTPDTAFTLGLIHDTGRLVFDTMLGETYAKVVRTAQEQGLPLERVETRMLLMNHADAMERILRAWHFPRELGDPVMLHHLGVDEMKSRSGSRFREAATLALADRLAHAMLIGSSGNETVYPTTAFCEALGLSPKAIADIENTIREKTTDLKIGMLSVSTSPGDWPDIREKLRERLGTPFRPLFAGSHPGLDAYRILCDALRTSDGDDPTLAVVHLAVPRDRAAFASLLAAAESAAAVSKLPVIVLRGDGVPPVSESDLAGRAAADLRTPINLERLFAAVRRLAGSQGLSKAA